MGSDGLLSKEQAAELLGIAVTTFETLVGRGVFTPKLVRDGSALPKRRYLVGEVEAYAASRNAKNTLAEVRLVAVQAISTARALERRVAFLEEALGARIRPPPLEEDDVINLFAEASDSLTAFAFNERNVLRWAKFFIGVGEEFFDYLEAVTGDENSWKVFYDLGQVIAQQTPAEVTDKGVEAAVAYFEVGRRNLRAVVFFHLLSRFGATTARRAIGVSEDVHEEIMHLLGTD